MQERSWPARETSPREEEVHEVRKDSTCHARVLSSKRSHEKRPQMPCELLQGMQECSWPARETSPREEDVRGRPGTSPQDGRGNPATKTPTLAKMVGSPLPPSPNSLTRAGIVHIVATMNPADIIPRLCILLLLGAALSPCGMPTEPCIGETASTPSPASR